MPDSEKVFLASLDVTVRVVAVAGLLPPPVAAEVQRRFGAYLGKPSCPALVYNEALEYLCDTCLGNRPRAAAYEFFGRHSLDRYRETILGRVLIAAMPMLGLERVLRRAPQDFALACNYGTRWVAELAPRHWRMDFEDEIMHPEVLKGVFAGLGELMQQPGLAITHTTLAPGHLSFELRW
jgi:uncharacterized protein (TIGR02265 family)